MAPLGCTCLYFMFVGQNRRNPSPAMIWRTAQDYRSDFSYAPPHRARTMTMNVKDRRGSCLYGSMCRAVRGAVRCIARVRADQPGGENHCSFGSRRRRRHLGSCAGRANQPRPRYDGGRRKSSWCRHCDRNRFRCTLGSRWLHSVDHQSGVPDQPAPAITKLRPDDQLRSGLQYCELSALRRCCGVLALSYPGGPGFDAPPRQARQRFLFASAGPATASYIALEALKHAVRIAVYLRPYAGTAPAVAALLGGDVAVVYAAIT